MVFSKRNLSEIDVLELLQKCENSFSPPLSHNIPYSVDEYAKKLANYASFVVCEDNDEIIGFTAYYTNIEGGFFYISQIWVSDRHQRQGIGAKMMETMMDNVPSSIRIIRLEVRKNNEKAVAFYEKNGFVVVTDEGEKCLLEMIITNNDVCPAL